MIAKLAQRLTRAVGLRSLGRFAASRWPFPVRATTYAGEQIYVDLRSSIGRSIFATGTFDSAVIEPLLAGLSPGDTFVDVGANIGFYSFVAYQRLRPGGRIFAFEIDPRPLRSLRKTVAERGLSGISVQSVGLSDAEGEAHFVPLSESGHNHLNFSGRGQAVPITTLDTWAIGRDLGRVKVMKVDVEGGELNVLRGAQAFIAQHRPLIICEVSDENLQRFNTSSSAIDVWLRNAGYSVTRLEGAHTETFVAMPSGSPMGQPA